MSDALFLPLIPLYHFSFPHIKIVLAVHTYTVSSKPVFFGKRLISLISFYPTNMEQGVGFECSTSYVQTNQYFIFLQ